MGEAGASGTSAEAADSTPASVGSKIARSLVAAGVLTADRLRYAERVHAKLPAERTLASVLLELEMIDEAGIRKVLRASRVSVPFGAVLVELGYIQPQDLTLALALQAEAPGTPLGEVIIRNGLAQEKHVLGLLADLLDIETGVPDSAVVDLVLLRKATPRVCRAHGFLPLTNPDGGLLVAMSDPLNRAHLDAMHACFGRDAAVSLTDRHFIATLLERAERDLAATASTNGHSPAVAAVQQILTDAIAERASDVHLEPMRDRLRVRFRQDGCMIPYKEFPQELATGIIGRIKVLAGADIAERRRHQDGRILFETLRGTVDIRVSIYVSIHGEKIVLRILNNQGAVLSIRDIGMAPRMLDIFQHDVLDSPSGVVIVTGPTGSGKTTTLYAAVNHLNEPGTSIITAEDPVEYVVDGVSQCSINPKINLSYEETLKHIVRQDPDVIVIGEIRDHFSAEVAVNAALTGHKVLTTFHTEDSIGGLVRLMNMNIEAFLISSTVVSVVAQRLLRRVCRVCAEDHVLSAHELRRLGYPPGEAGGITFKRGRGCAACRQQGYRGRVAVFELLVLNERVRDAIVSHKTSYDIRRISTETSGLVTLLEDGIAKAASGETSFDEIIRELPRLSPPRSLGEVRRLLGARE